MFCPKCHMDKTKFKDRQGERREILIKRGLLKKLSDRFFKKNYISKIRNYGFVSRVMWISNSFQQNNLVLEFWGPFCSWDQGNPMLFTELQWKVRKMKWVWEWMNSFLVSGQHFSAFQDVCVEHRDQGPSNATVRCIYSWLSQRSQRGRVSCSLGREVFKGQHQGSVFDLAAEKCASQICKVHETQDSKGSLKIVQMNKINKMKSDANN